MLDAVVPVEKTLLTCTGINAPVLIPIKVTSSPPTVKTLILPAVPTYNHHPKFLPVAVETEGISTVSLGVTAAALYACNF